MRLCPPDSKRLYFNRFVLPHAFMASTTLSEQATSVVSSSAACIIQVGTLLSPQGDFASQPPQMPTQAATSSGYLLT